MIIVTKYNCQLNVLASNFFFIVVNMYVYVLYKYVFYVIIYVITIRIEFLVTNENNLNVKDILNNYERRILSQENQPKIFHLYE